MNVTEEIRQKNVAYGASDYTAAHSLGASKSLNYAKGPSITRPDNQTVSVLPHTVEYKGEIGLFGVENYFTKVQLAITGDRVLSCYAERGWKCAFISSRGLEETGWQPAVVEPLGCLSTLNSYECADLIGDNLPYIVGGGYLSIELVNNGTNNQYHDKSIDARLYTTNKEEHPYDKMYVKTTDCFYIGLHARNTRQTPFDLSCVIGVEYISYDSIENKDMIMRRSY